MSDQKHSLLVLFGGQSSEHEVSCNSAASVIEHLDQNKYNLYQVGITREGLWFLTSAEPKRIKDGSWIKDPSNKKVFIRPSIDISGLVVFNDDYTYEIIDIDVVFPVLHGKYGEDGTLQGLLDLTGLPYVGSGTTSSATCMDKAITKLIVAQTGIRQADYYLTDRYTFADQPQETIKSILTYFDEKFPLFVKPPNAGSSVGISKVKDTKSLFDGIRIAAAEDHKILIEETIIGREIEVAVLGDRHPKASLVGEILAANEFYDYDAKYVNEGSKTRVITDLSPEKEEEIRKAAIDIYRGMGCKGLARADFFLTDAGEVVFNEINTMPGFTQISMYPKLWEATDLPYTELLDELIGLALGDIE